MRCFIKYSNLLFWMPNIKESGLRLNSENSPGSHRYPYIFLFKVCRNWKRVVRFHVGVPSISWGIWLLLSRKQFLLYLQICLPIDHVSELHSTAVALVMIKRRLQTVQTAQTVQAVQFFVCFFLNCDLLMIKVYTPLSCSFGNVFPSFGHHMTKFYEFISNSRYLARQSSWRLAPDGKMYRRCYFCGKWRWFRGMECAVWTKQMITGSSKDSPKNFTVKKVLQAKIELY